MQKGETRTPVLRQAGAYRSYCTQNLSIPNGMQELVVFSYSTKKKGIPKEKVTQKKLGA